VLPSLQGNRVKTCTITAIRNVSMNSVDKEEWLQRARDHCFYIGVNDSGAELCRINSAYGIAGIQFVQRELGMKPDATFITTPDMTITRNASRWKSGFGYGGKISWGNGDDELIILNTKPNACGMLAGGLQKLPDIESLIRKLHAMEVNTTQIDGIDLIWDFYKSNHFIDIFEIKHVAKTDVPLPPYAFIIHGSADEFKGDSAMGFGLYYDVSRELSGRTEIIATPFGNFYLLTGENARAYYERYRYIDEFTKRKRRLAADLLFGDYTLISNETHQGLINMNEILLGCHHVADERTLFPLTLRGDLPAYLVHGMPNLTPESIDLLGFEKRSMNLGIYDRLIGANIIPHGGGYVLPDILTVNRVTEVDGKRYFEVEMQNDRGKKIISEVRDLPFEYRGRNVVLRALEVGLIDIVAKLIPRYVFKI